MAKKSVIAVQIRKLLDERGLKQKKIAELAGFEYRTFNNMLNGTKTITGDDVAIICSVLNVEPNVLYGFESTETA